MVSDFWLFCLPKKVLILWKIICWLGLSWEETIRRKPDDIVAACHNSGDSVTISGPPESIAKFVKKLQAENIFAKEVKSSGFAFHSKYIADAGPKLRKHLERVSRLFSMVPILIFHAIRRYISFYFGQHLVAILNDFFHLL